MTLPSSGPISASQINVELGRSSTATLCLNCSAVRALAGVPSGTISYSNFYGKSAIKASVVFNSPGCFTWVVPTGVTSVSVVAVGGGGGGGWYSGGGGGGLGYKNNYSVTPGASYTVHVGGAGIGSSGYTGTQGGDSYFVSTCVVYGGGGIVTYCTYTYGGSHGGNGGGNGGLGTGTSRGVTGGGGAGGYSGNGGDGGYCYSVGPTSGSGGGGAGGGSAFINNQSGGGGGGVGLFGQGSNGVPLNNGPYGSSYGAAGSGGGGGSAGGNGGAACGTSTRLGVGGAYGGGGGAGAYCQCGGCWCGSPGSPGAVRVLWPGNSRQFPSTCVSTTGETGSAIFEGSIGTFGTYTWLVPPGVTKISIVAVGMGAAGLQGGGGALGYRNNISVTSGQKLLVRVGSASFCTVGTSIVACGGTPNICTCFYVKADGGNLFNANAQYHGSCVYGGYGGSAHGSSNGFAGGGGAGGYSGNGGNGGWFSAGTSGSGGAGGGGGGSGGAGGGGGVGLYGQGSSGAGGGSGSGGGGGSNGENGYPGCSYIVGSGGSYGGGGAWAYIGGVYSFSYPGKGAVRIVWPGDTRQFPSTNVCASKG